MNKNPFQSDDTDSSSNKASNPPDPSDSDEDFSVDFKKNIPDEVLWGMFNTGVSFRALSKILELAFGLFNQSQTFHVSTSHLFQRYKSISIKKENDYKLCIRAENNYGTICFDHQKMRQMSNKYAELTDRLAVVWHSNKSNRLITVGEMADKTGESQAQSIQTACADFNISRDQVVALTCDNASTNTGHISGTCTILEKLWQKPLLRLMCNHHISEIVVKDVYHYLFSSDSPNNLFYPILKERWMELKEIRFPYNSFDEISYTENLDGSEDRLFEELRQIALEDMRTNLKSPSIRDDYKELNILGIRFFGERFNRHKTNQAEFYALINPSNARFMGAAIQGIKCYLFRYQLNWESAERRKIRKNLERFVLFVTLVYIRLWNGSNVLFDTGINTVEFLRNLEKYAELDFDIAKVAKDALCRHLYYMSEELSVLSMFSTKVSCDEKNEIAAMLLQQNNVNLPVRRITPDEVSNHIRYSNDIEFGNINQLRVADLVGERSFYLFNVMNISTEFLHNDARTWFKNNEYLRAKHLISKTLTCVNDTSERVISASKYKYKRQRCKTNDSFRRSMFAASY